MPKPSPALLLPLFLLVCGGYGALSSASEDEGSSNDEGLQLRTVQGPGVVLHKTPRPLDEGPVGDDFPGALPARFIRDAFGVDAPTSPGGIKLMNQTAGVCADDEGEEAGDDESINLDETFGKAILSRAKDMFDERGCRDELDAFLATGVSNLDAGPRRMHWVGIEILPHQSLALHSHPNIEFAYIVEGVMHEYRIVDHSIEKKRGYVPETVVMDDGGTTHLKYRGPDHLADVDASREGIFRHNHYSAGDMFINTIGDVHQSFTRGEGVKLFVMWGDGNADVPADKFPQNSGFLNVQSAKAWD